MIKIIKNRGSGKTTELIHIACANNYQYDILCATYKEKEHIKKCASNMGYSPLKLNVYTIAELEKDGHVYKPFLVDNLESVFFAMMPNQFVGFSISLD